MKMMLTMTMMQTTHRVDKDEDDDCKAKQLDPAVEKNKKKTTKTMIKECHGRPCIEYDIHLLHCGSV